MIAESEGRLKEAEKLQAQAQKLEAKSDVREAIAEEKTGEAYNVIPAAPTQAFDRIKSSATSSRQIWYGEVNDSNTFKEYVLISIAKLYHKQIAAGFDIEEVLATVRDSTQYSLVAVDSVALNQYAKQLKKPTDFPGASVKVKYA